MGLPNNINIIDWLCTKTKWFSALWLHGPAGATWPHISDFVTKPYYLQHFRFIGLPNNINISTWLCAKKHVIYSTLAPWACRSNITPHHRFCIEAILFTALPLHRLAQKHHQKYMTLRQNRTIYSTLAPWACRRNMTQHQYLCNKTIWFTALRLHGLPQQHQHN